ncbi:hypothetical protein ACS0TY_015425 [Phlomoides rotata]
MKSASCVDSLIKYAYSSNEKTIRVRRRVVDAQPYSMLSRIPDQIGLMNRYVSVEEQVSMFLSILAHHKKNRVVKFDYHRSGQTVSHYVHIVLQDVLSLHIVLLVRPAPVPDNSIDHIWKWFKEY